jgi:uncharacterized protein
MAQHFVDSSALLKRYRRESGSQWMLDLVNASERVIVARLGHVEVSAAIVRRGRQTGSPPEQVAAALATLELDREMRELFRVIEFGEPVVRLAIVLTRAHSLRAADAIQLASALLSRQALPTAADFVLVSADDELNAAATAEGLQVDNPNLHP